MTGTDRLRAIAGAWDEWGLGGELAEMADQIERERTEDCYRMGLDCGTVWRVVADMERHCLGHEGMEDSPVARWARELRDALKSYTSDGSEAQKPSWHDHAEAADVTSDAPKVTRDPAEDVSMSAYDLLPQDERDAIAWVRERGGIEAVKEEWNHSRNLKRSLETAQAKVERQQRHIEFVQGKCRERQERIVELNKMVSDMRLRLMPEGMEWPRFEDGEKLTLDSAPIGVEGVEFPLDASGYALCCGVGPKRFRFCERVKRPAPKVLDADGAEIREKRDVWWICEGDERGVHAEMLHVDGIDGDGMVECSPYNGGTLVVLDPAELYVKKPVLDADGRPLREGETVWDANGDELVIGAIEDGGHTVTCRYVDVGDGIPTHGMWSPSDLTQQRPDSWERWRSDLESAALGYAQDAYHGLETSIDFDGFVRRCRALAERERGE